MLTKSKFVGLAALATLWAGPALADTTIYTMNLSVNLGNQCRLPTTVPSNNTEAILLTQPLSDGAFITGSKSLTVNCTVGLNYTVDLDAGTNSTTADGRRLKGPGSSPLFIPYKVYKQTANTSEWAADAAPTSVTAVAAGETYVFSIKSTTVRSGFPAGATGTFTDQLKFAIVFP